MIPSPTMEVAKRYTYTILLITICVTILFQDCKKEQQVRKLNEKSTSIAHQQKREVTTEQGDKKFSWQKPAHWQVEESKGLRLATFTINNQIVCTLIPLSRDGGGLKANIQRWSSQLALRLTPQQVQSFIDSKIDFKTKTNLSAAFLDFNPLVANENKLSMLVTIITTPKSTLFIKMTGSKKLLEKQRDPFISFCKSISHNQ